MTVERENMGIDYTPLRVTLAKKNIGITQLKNMIGCSPSTIAKIRKNQPVSLRVIEDICKALSVPVEEVVEYIETPRA